MRAESEWAPAGVELHRDLIRKRWEKCLNGTGYGCVSCFRAVRDAVSGAQVQTNIYQVCKVHAHFLSLPKEHICVHSSANTRQQILEMWQKRVFIAILFKLVSGTSILVVLQQTWFILFRLFFAAVCTFRV